MPAYELRAKFRTPPSKHATLKDQLQPKGDDGEGDHEQVEDQGSLHQKNRIIRKSTNLFLCLFISLLFFVYSFASMNSLSMLWLGLVNTFEFNN